MMHNLSQLLELVTITFVDGNVNIYIPEDASFLLQESIDSFISSIKNSLFGSTTTLSESNLASFNPPKSFTHSHFYLFLDLYAGYQDILNNIGSRAYIYIDPIHSFVNSNFRLSIYLAPLLLLVNYIYNFFRVSFNKIISLIVRTFYIYRDKFKKPYLYVKSFLEKKLENNNINLLQNFVKNIVRNTVPSYLRNFQVRMHRRIAPQISMLMTSRRVALLALRNRAQRIQNYVNEMAALVREHNIDLVVTVLNSNPNERQLDFIYPSNMPDDLVEVVRNRVMNLDHYILTNVDELISNNNELSGIEVQLTRLSHRNFVGNSSTPSLRIASNAMVLYNSLITLEYQ